MARGLVSRTEPNQPQATGRRQPAVAGHTLSAVPGEAPQNSHFKKKLKINLCTVLASPRRVGEGALGQKIRNEDYLSSVAERLDDLG